MKIVLGMSTAVILVLIGAVLPASYAYSATTTPVATEETVSEDATPTPSTSEDYEEIAAHFFETLGSEGGKAALEYAFSTNPYSSRLEDELSVVINQLSSAEDLLGEYTGNELLVETRVSDKLVTQYYLVMYERQPLKFELTFYKPQDEWVFQNFVFNASIIEDISTITRLSLLDSDKVTIHPSESTVISDDVAQID